MTHNLRRGERAFSLTLRRVVKITRVAEKHHSYEVITVDGDRLGAEAECYELVAIDRNQRAVAQISKLYDQIAELSGQLL